MESLIETKHSHSMGKHLRKKKNLRKKDPNAELIEPSSQMLEYIDFLKKNNLQINRVGLGRFYTKNNMAYTGLITLEPIPSNFEFIRCPVDLLLTTKKAFLSPIKFIYTENPEFFSPKYSKTSWEDHIILVYLLFEYQKGAESFWFHMIRNLPRDVEYLIFWKEADLRLLDDPVFEAQTKLNHQQFEQEYMSVRAILEKYPSVFQPETYSFDNIKWIYGHLVTRCFGKYLCYVTMVPFAELLNHECSDVFYDFHYEPENPYCPKPLTKEEPRWVSEKDEVDAQTSDESYESQDPLSDNEYTYEKPGSNGSPENGFEQKVQKSEPLPKGQPDQPQAKPVFAKKPVAGSLDQMVRDVKQWIFNNLNYGDSFSIFYVTQVEEYLAKIDSIPLEKAKIELSNLQIGNSHYKRELHKYYTEYSKANSHICQPVLEQKRSKNFKDDGANEEAKKEEEPFIENDFMADEEWEDDKFDYFVMKTSDKDSFEQNSQMYFCYGRLSNRMLLNRYGCSIEFNKYDHVHVRINFMDYLSQTGKDLVCTNKLSKYKRFKIKITKFNFHILNFFKATLWKLEEHLIDSLLIPSELNLEIEALRQLQSFYQTWLQSCRHSIEINEEIIRNPKTNSHEYFSAIYRVERQRIIANQLKLVKILLIILQTFGKGVPLESAIRKTDIETEDEKDRNRYLLAPYLKRMRFWKPYRK